MIYLELVCIMEDVWTQEHIYRYITKIYKEYIDRYCIGITNSFEIVSLQKEADMSLCCVLVFDCPRSVCDIKSQS